MTSKPPPSPRAFISSLNSRAGNGSKLTGVPAGELIELYYHRRLLARVFHSDQDGWVLKGGQALLVRWPRARYSTDVDLLRVSEDVTVDGAVEALIAAASIELDDHLRFDHHDTSRETAANRPSRKVRFKVMLGLRELHTVSVDVVAAELHPVGQLVVEQLEAPFVIDSSPWPEISMWPLEDHVADKIAAMYERHREGLVPSTRFKDLVDLVLIACNSTLDGAIAHQALHAEVRRRTTAGTHLVLPAAFAVPDASWTAGYRAEAAKTKELSVEHRTLEGVTSLADAFITPLLQERPQSGIWLSDRLRWE